MCEINFTPRYLFQCVKAILFLDILKNKLNVNAKNDMGNTPLHLASKWGYGRLCKSFKLSFQCVKPIAFLVKKCVLLINVKMPTIVGILTFMNRINYWL